jgi:hypothetical protein
VRPADDGEGLDIPVGEVLLPAPGRLGLAPDAEAPLIPFSLTYGGERGSRHIGWLGSPGFR